VCVCVCGGEVVSQKPDPAGSNGNMDSSCREGVICCRSTGNHDHCRAEVEVRSSGRKEIPMGLLSSFQSMLWDSFPPHPGATHRGLPRPPLSARDLLGSDGGGGGGGSNSLGIFSKAELRIPLEPL
jgi:hypothetical protein